ncbi:MAG: sensor histidine kinase [Anaerolineales bacterium]
MKNRRLTYLITIGLTLAATLGLAALIMRPSTQELIDMAIMFAAAGLGASLVGFLSVQAGWWRRAPSLTQTLTVGHLLAAIFGLVIVLLAARLMFISEHDLALAGVLLFFASSVAVSFGYFFSNSITQRLKELDRGASRLSEGDFSVRVAVDGRDEVAELGVAFNAMAERLEQAEREADRLEEARREFISGASHDLRTPLSSLRAMLDAIADGVVEDPSDYIRRSQRVITQMSNLTDDLVELAMLDSGAAPIERSLQSIEEVIDSAIEGAALRAEAKGVELTGPGDQELPLIPIAADKIGRVLQNLLDNAIDHSRMGGEVRVSAEERNGSVEVSVRDTGDGIHAESLPYIFERFYRGEESRSRADSDVGGVGLGLAIAKELVEAHGGSIWADSGSQHGTKITFSLPMEPSAGSI